MWTKKMRWKVAMRNSGKTLKILLNLIMGSNDTWANKCVLTMTMSHNYGHTFSHLSNYSIFWMCKMWKLGQSFWRGSKNVDRQFILSIATPTMKFPSIYCFCCFYLLVIVSLTLMNISVKPVNLCTFYFAKFC